MKKPKCSLSSFKELKNVIKIKEKPDKEKTDEEIFLEAMADVREKREFREIPYKSPMKINSAPFQPECDVKVLMEIISGKSKIRLSDTGEYIDWVRPGARKDLAKRLHRGDFSVQDYIDLHGLSLVEAEEVLREFFLQHGFVFDLPVVAEHFLAHGLNIFFVTLRIFQFPFLVVA